MTDERRKELERRLEAEKADLEVEKRRGKRPLEDLTGGDEAGAPVVGGTTWTPQQDDEAARSEHADDARKSLEDSEEQVRRVEEALRRMREESKG